MKLLGSPIANLATLRALAIQCHALNLLAGELLFAGTHVDKDEKTKSSYEEQFTSMLLSLAIALRTKFYQGYDHRSTIPYVMHCGFLSHFGEDAEDSVVFSMKDVCDKIIHSRTVEKDLAPEIEKATTTLHGKDTEGVEWELSISVSLFAEAVLNWLRDMEASQPARPDRQLATTTHVADNHR